MDSDFLKNLEYFTVPNNQTSNVSEQVGESSTAGAARNTRETDLWETLAAAESGLSAGAANQDLRPVGPFSQSTPAIRNQAGHSSLAGAKRDLPSRTAASAHSQRRREGHDKKRQKAEPVPSVLESTDDWLQFDNDEADHVFGGSFEIDFSKRQNSLSNYNRAPGYVNPIAPTPGLGTGLYTTPLFKEDDFLDDNALENALSDDEDVLESMNLSEQLSNIESQPPQEVPPREGLYSTPLSWERPAPGLRMNPLFGIGTPMLDPEQRRLLAIALNTGGSSASLASGFGLGSDLESSYSSLGNLRSTGGTASLSEISKEIGDESLKDKGKGKERRIDETSHAAFGKQGKGPRQSTAKTGLAMPEKLLSKDKAPDRTAHNDIERKYRTNLKDKIAELRDAVPSLRSLPEEGDEEEEEENASRSAPKVSKGTILLKATEYIHQLERRNKIIMKEHADLARRLQAFEQLLTATARQPYPLPSYGRALFDPRGFC